LNPSAGDVSVFLPLEHAMLSRSVPDDQRTRTFARYSLVGALVGALGALMAGLPELGAPLLHVDTMTAYRAMFVLYASLGLVTAGIYRGLPKSTVSATEQHAAPLGPSKRIVYTLAALFSVDAFAGGFIVQSLLALWLLQRYDLSVAEAGFIFFWTGVFSAFSYLVAAKIATKIGLVNTMVFTHIPSSVLLILVPFMPSVGWAIALLLVRSALSQMDVPTRSSYVMAVVTPAERPAAASITAVPRSLASAVSPLIAGWLLALSPFGWPLIVAGGLKIAYDLMLLAMFSKVKPPEEVGAGRRNSGPGPQLRRN
jgi:predicted MFS family arabinose efflux permease